MGIDYYNLLGIARIATDFEIKKAYRKMSLKYHPDKNPEDQNAADRFMEIAESYDVLSDAKKRAVFDQFGEEGLKSGLPEGSSGYDLWPIGYTFDRNPEKVFREFFGGDNPFQEYFDRAALDLRLGFGGPNGYGAKKQVPPIEKDLYLTLEEVFHGCTKKIKISKKVLNQDGNTSSIHDKILTISVKKGWKSGTKITFCREGDQGPNNIPSDIVFTLKDKPHPRFRREGTNLIHMAKVPLACALIGCTISIHTLDERILHIPITDIVKPGYTKTVCGEGMPLVAAPCDRGNLIIEFEIVYPTLLTLQKKDLLRKALLS